MFLTSGITQISNNITSPVFGHHQSQNVASYAQVDFKVKKVDFTVGTRLEYMPHDSKFKIGSFETPIYPIFGGTVRHKAINFSHLRASYGKGIRFSSVAKRFVSTSVGGLVIYNNPNLKPKTGWTGEIG